jgi:glycerol uptake facilitator-like aquaporin
VQVIGGRTVGSSTLSRRLAAELVGTAFLLATVVGSGIMAETLSGGNAGLALLANALATGGALGALILAFGSVSGAHFNPIVTASDAALGRFAWREVPAYWLAQVAGALAGVALAHVMFEKPIFFASTHVRAGTAQLVGEATAAFGLLVVIFGCVRSRPAAVPFAVAAYITSAYWFTSSTSFANPAVTVARACSDTFAGIRPADVPAFVVAQFFGGLLATLFVRWLAPDLGGAPVETQSSAPTRLEGKGVA